LTFAQVICVVRLCPTGADLDFLQSAEPNAVTVIGLYCIPVLIDLVAVPERHLKVEKGVNSVRIGEAFCLAMNSKFNLVRSSVVGTLVGILPGAGGLVAGLVAYSEAKRTTKPR
jgi:putative tricarboxylic transport membrane protein